MKNRPRHLEDSLFLSADKAVPDREFVRFSNPASLPAGFGDDLPDGFCFTVFAASGYSPSADTVIGDFTPSGKLIVQRTFRTCTHDGALHHNVDERIMWMDCEGRYWQVHSEDAPDHYKQLLSATGLEDVCVEFGYPKAERGNITEIRSSGGYLDFRKSCPGFPDA